MAEPTSSSTGFIARWLGILTLLFAAFGVTYLASAPSYELPESDPGVILFRYNERSESTELREQGFLDTMKKEFPGINILSSDQYLGSTRSSAVRRSHQIVERFGDAITGIFCVNESSTGGCLQALQELNQASAIPLVGFDVTPAMIAAVKRGEMSGFVVQDPKSIGYEAVKAARAHLLGERVDDQVHTSHYLVTDDNVSAEEIRPLIYPKRFSGDSFDPEEAKFTLGFVTRGTTHDFWQSIRAGVEEASREAGDTLIRFEAPAIEDSVDGQIEIVAKMIADGVDAICLAPIDSTALGKVVAEAKQAGVPVILFDTGLDYEQAPEAGDAVVCYVSTNNYEAGAAAARHMAAVLKTDSSAN